VRYNVQWAARILQDDKRKNECVMIYRKRRVYYRLINDRTIALQFTENDAYHRNRAMTKQRVITNDVDYRSDN